PLSPGLDADGVAETGRGTLRSGAESLSGARRHHVGALQFPVHAHRLPAVVAQLHGGRLSDDGPLRPAGPAGRVCAGPPAVRAGRSRHDLRLHRVPGAHHPALPAAGAADGPVPPVNTLWSLIATYPAFMVPFATWMLTAYFTTIPRDVEESALVDGCTRTGALRHVVLPLARPGIITAALFGFTLAYSEFIYALTFISTTSLKTVTTGVVVDLIRGDFFYWGSLRGGALVASLPVVLLFSL